MVSVLELVEVSVHELVVVSDVFIGDKRTDMEALRPLGSSSLYRYAFGFTKSTFIM